MKTEGKKGFTVLELLVVIAIIGVLAAVTLVLLNGAQARGRDARRMADMGELQKALNLYYTNHNGFPNPHNNVVITGDDAFSLDLENDGVISETPPDPVYPSATYRYQYTSADGTGFSLSFCLETDTIPGRSQGCGNTISEQ